MEESSVTERAASGVPGLDTMLGGGFPRGHIVLLAGDSGTGKTMLSMEWLFNGRSKDSETGLYLTMTETVTAAEDNLSDMAFYDSDVLGSDGMHFADLRSTLDIVGTNQQLNEDDIKGIIDAIAQMVDETGAERIVLDSITALAQLIDDEGLIRQCIFELGAMLEHKDVTTILISEVSRGDGYSVYGVEEFISDGIVMLEQEPINDDLRRTLQIHKMRGIDHDSTRATFTINDTGIDVTNFGAELEYTLDSNRISTGIPGMDKLFEGGVFRRSTTLVNGTTGTGKTLSGLHFAQAGLENGDTVVFVNFEESAAQLQNMAQAFGWDLSGDGIRFHCVRPDQHYPMEHVQKIMEQVDAVDADRVIIDPLTSIREFSEDQSTFSAFVRELGLELRDRDVTTLFTSARDELLGAKSLGSGRISAFVDNIVLYNIVEADGLFERTAAIWKMRNTGHSNAIHRYSIDADGITIGEPLEGYEGTMSGDARVEAAEHQAAVIENILWSTLDATDIGILVVDTDRNIQRYNEQFLEIWDVPPDIVEEGDDEAALEAAADQLEEPAQFKQRVKEIYEHPDETYTDRLEFKDGRIIQRHGIPHTVDGELEGVVWSFKDVTEHYDQ